MHSLKKPSPSASFDAPSPHAPQSHATSTSASLLPLLQPHREAQPQVQYIDYKTAKLISELTPYRYTTTMGAGISSPAPPPPTSAPAPAPASTPATAEAAPEAAAATAFAIRPSVAADGTRLPVEFAPLVSIVGSPQAERPISVYGRANPVLVLPTKDPETRLLRSAVKEFQEQHTAPAATSLSSPLPSSSLSHPKPSHNPPVVSPTLRREKAPTPVYRKHPKGAEPRAHAAHTQPLSHGSRSHTKSSTRPEAPARTQSAPSAVGSPRILRSLSSSPAPAAEALPHSSDSPASHLRPRASLAKPALLFTQTIHVPASPHHLTPRASSSHTPARTPTSVRRSSSPDRLAQLIERNSMIPIAYEEAPAIAVPTWRVTDDKTPLQERAPTAQPGDLKAPGSSSRLTRSTTGSLHRSKSVGDGSLRSSHPDHHSRLASELEIAMQNETASDEETDDETFEYRHKRPEFLEKRSKRWEKEQALQLQQLKKKDVYLVLPTVYHNNFAEVQHQLPAIATSASPSLNQFLTLTSTPSRSRCRHPHQHQHNTNHSGNKHEGRASKSASASADVSDGSRAATPSTLAEHDTRAFPETSGLVRSNSSIGSEHEEPVSPVPTLSCGCPFSFHPPPEAVERIEVTDTLPLSAFGCALPHFETKVFSLPKGRADGFARLIAERGYSRGKSASDDDDDDDGDGENKNGSSELADESGSDEEFELPRSDLPSQHRAASTFKRRAETSDEEEQYASSDTSDWDPQSAYGKQSSRLRRSASRESRDGPQATPHNGIGTSIVTRSGKSFKLLSSPSLSGSMSDSAAESEEGHSLRMHKRSRIA